MEYKNAVYQPINKSIYRIYSPYLIVKFTSSFIVLRYVFKPPPPPIYSARNFVTTNRAER